MRVGLCVMCAFVDSIRMRMTFIIYLLDGELVRRLLLVQLRVLCLRQDDQSIAPKRSAGCSSSMNSLQSIPCNTLCCHYDLE